MKAEWHRIEEVFLSALDHSVEERIAFVRAACAGDASLQEAVEALLRSHEETEGFLEQPAYQVNAELFADDEGSLKAGESFGEYRILSLLGEGGMGAVYLAEDTTLGRRVALKLVKSGPGRASLVRHFHREERILAGLTHPNIARLYGGAVTPEGTPYFVMEYVEGERLDSYCDRRQLPIRERLELFRKICSAVSYAHQHLVIHRDLKPANIRVTTEGEPKLLDFGIARLLDNETAVASDQTMTLTAAMTPEYASPEQLRGEAMTTASDVYSLGVVLYELLTGKKPYRTKSRRIDEVTRAIIEQEPSRPSTAAARGGDSKLGPSRTGTRISKFLRGDLDNIVLTAIRKEPARRYSSVGQFSDDIRRHLEGRPIVARKDAVGYRASKFIRRNRTAVAAAALVFAILTGLFVALGQAKEARAQRDVAQNINRFLQDMLGAAAPEVKGINVKVSDLLNEASIRARAELARQPDVMADVLMTLGRTYISLGQLDKAEADLRTALEASLKANGELHPTTATTLGWLGLALGTLDKSAEGEQISRRAVELQRKLHPRGNEDLGVALYALGRNLIGRKEPKAAQPILKEASELIRKHLGETHGYHLASLVMLATAYERAGDSGVAEPLYRQAIEVGGRVEPRYRIFRVQAQAYLGVLLIGKGTYPEAETLLRQSEAAYRELYGGDENYSVGDMRAYLGWLYFLQADYTRAEDESRKALDLLRKYFGPEHSRTVVTTATLGMTLTRAGKATEGEPYLREALALRRKILPPENPDIFRTESELGACLTAQKRYDEAEPLLLGGYNGLNSKLGDKDSRTIEARQRLVQLYETWNKPEQAARYRE